MTDDRQQQEEERPWADLTPEEQRVYSGGAVLMHGTEDRRLTHEAHRRSIARKRACRRDLDRLAPELAEAVLAVFAVHGRLRHTCDELVTNDCPECAIGLAVRPLANKLRRIGGDA